MDDIRIKVLPKCLKLLFLPSSSLPSPTGPFSGAWASATTCCTGNSSRQDPPGETLHPLGDNLHPPAGNSPARDLPEGNPPGDGARGASLADEQDYVSMLYGLLDQARIDVG